jgi:hypothetical protein
VNQSQPHCEQFIDRAEFQNKQVQRVFAQNSKSSFQPKTISKLDFPP